MAPRASPAARLERIRAALVAGRAVGPEDAAAFVAAIDRAAAAEATLEEGLGLFRGWQARGLEATRRAAIAILTEGPGSARRRAVSAYRELRRYAASGFAADKQSANPPSGRRGEMFRFLGATGGKVPSDDAIRKALA